MFVSTDDFKSLCAYILFCADELVEVEGISFPLDLHVVEFTEDECMLCVLDDRLADTDFRVVDLVDPLEPGGGIDRISEGGILDLFSLASDVPDDRRSFVDPHAYPNLESVFPSESVVELADLLLLGECSATGEDSLLRLGSECSPYRHDRISLVFVDESVLVHDDIRDLLEVNTQEPDKLFWFHILREGGEPSDIGEESGDLATYPSEAHLFVVVEDIEDEVLCEVLREGVSQEAFPLLLVDIFVPRDADRDQEYDHEELHGISEELMKESEIEVLSE